MGNKPHIQWQATAPEIIGVQGIVLQVFQHIKYLIYCCLHLLFYHFIAANVYRFTKLANQYNKKKYT
jgi:hypothetical protein